MAVVNVARSKPTPDNIWDAASVIVVIGTV